MTVPFTISTPAADTIPAPTVGQPPAPPMRPKPDSITRQVEDSETIVWGGENGSTNLNTGGRYNPITDSWTPTSTTNTPTQAGHTAVWTGSEMIVWGGWGFPWNTGGRYCAAAAGPTPTPTRTPTPNPTPTPTSTPTPTATPIPRPITVTFNTNPAGLSYRVDGTTYNSAHVFSWRSARSYHLHDFTTERWQWGPVCMAELER